MTSSTVEKSMDGNLGQMRLELSHFTELSFPIIMTDQMAMANDWTFW